MGMSKDDFRKQYKVFQPEATDEEIDKLYDEATAALKAGKSFFSDTKSSIGTEGRPIITKEDWAKVDWQTVAEVVLSSGLQRYVNYLILKHAASKVLGRKVGFREVYFASMALRALTRTVTEVGTARVDIEKKGLKRLMDALEPVTKK